MNGCDINGQAIVERRHPSGVLRWLQSDTEIHVNAEAVERMDDTGREFFDQRYTLGEWCPYERGYHARLREVTLERPPEAHRPSVERRTHPLEGDPSERLEDV